MLKSCQRATIYSKQCLAFKIRFQQSKGHFQILSDALAQKYRNKIKKTGPRSLQISKR